ncbi:hypothetical protein B0H11DRAFT_2015166 [Mycena galericulata]|nr:hypothetical protein B0H11DRAFT_2015166 [Mycena galericulata]
MPAWAAALKKDHLPMHGPLWCLLALEWVLDVLPTVLQLVAHQTRRRVVSPLTDCEDEGSYLEGIVDVQGSHIPRSHSSDHPCHLLCRPLRPRGYLPHTAAACVAFVFECRFSGTRRNRASGDDSRAEADRLVKMDLQRGIEQRGDSVYRPRRLVAPPEVVERARKQANRPAVSATD